MREAFSPDSSSRCVRMASGWAAAQRSGTISSRRASSACKRSSNSAGTSRARALPFHTGRIVFNVPADQPLAPPGTNSSCRQSPGAAGCVADITVHGQTTIDRISKSEVEKALNRQLFIEFCPPPIEAYPGNATLVRPCPWQVFLQTPEAEPSGSSPSRIRSTISGARDVSRRMRPT